MTEPSIPSPPGTAAPAELAHAGPPRLTVHEGRATITLGRPEHHNRLHVEDLLTLQQHFASLQADPAVSLVMITAIGPSFCSGFHLGSLAEREPQAGGPQLFEQTVDALEALEIPTVCRLNGGVYGGAIDLALACDFRLGMRGMALRMPAARLGLHYYPSGLRRYVSRLGLQQAKRLFLLAETLHGPELLALGFLDRMADNLAGLDAEVATITDALAAGAPLALRGMKTSLNEIARGEYHLSQLTERMARCAHSQDLQEGMAAARDKRVPRFSGR